MTTIDANNPFGVSRTHHILSVLVQNRPGVLARVSGLFARRGYNIYSLAVAPTDDPRHSRITIVVDISETPLEQIVNQLFKLIDVVRITEMSPSTSVERELLLVTVRAGEGERTRVLELAHVYEAAVLAVGEDAMTLSLAAEPAKLDDFGELLRGHGIVEIQRTGRVALPRLDRDDRSDNPQRKA